MKAAWKKGPNPPLYLLRSMSQFLVPWVEWIRCLFVGKPKQRTWRELWSKQKLNHIMLGLLSRNLPFRGWIMWNFESIIIIHGNAFCYYATNADSHRHVTQMKILFHFSLPFDQPEEVRRQTARPSSLPYRPFTDRTWLSGEAALCVYSAFGLTSLWIPLSWVIKPSWTLKSRKKRTAESGRLMKTRD